MTLARQLYYLLKVILPIYIVDDLLLMPQPLVSIAEVCIQDTLTTFDAKQVLNKKCINKSTVYYIDINCILI